MALINIPPRHNHAQEAMRQEQQQVISSITASINAAKGREYPHRLGQPTVFQGDLEAANFIQRTSTSGRLTSEHRIGALSSARLLDVNGEMFTAQDTRDPMMDSYIRLAAGIISLYQSPAKRSPETELIESREKALTLATIYQNAANRLENWGPVYRQERQAHLVEIESLRQKAVDMIRLAGKTSPFGKSLIEM